MKQQIEKRKILLADDDSDDRMLFENAYSDRVDVIMLPSVENGVEVIKSLNNIEEDDDLPDLIIICLINNIFIGVGGIYNGAVRQTIP